MKVAMCCEVMWNSCGIGGISVVSPGAMVWYLV